MDKTESAILPQSLTGLGQQNSSGMAERLHWKNGLKPLLQIRQKWPCPVRRLLLKRLLTSQGTGSGLKRSLAGKSVWIILQWPLRLLSAPLFPETRNGTDMWQEMSRL